MKIARIIVTEKCNRNCHLCCMKMPFTTSNKKYLNLDTIKNYDQIIITGGEPLLLEDNLIQILRQITWKNFHTPMFLYTAIFNTALIQCYNYFKGITYTMHQDSTDKDYLNFERFEWFSIKNRLPETKSIRLAVISGIKNLIINPKAWSFIKVKQMMTKEELIQKSPTKNGLPEGEELLYF